MTQKTLYLDLHKTIIINKNGKYEPKYSELPKLLEEWHEKGLRIVIVSARATKKQVKTELANAKINSNLFEEIITITEMNKKKFQEFEKIMKTKNSKFYNELIKKKYKDALKKAFLIQQDMKQHNIKPENATMIGDKITDLLAGKINQIRYSVAFPLPLRKKNITEAHKRIRSKPWHEFKRVQNFLKK